MDKGVNSGESYIEPQWVPNIGAEKEITTAPVALVHHNLDPVTIRLVAI